MSKRFTPAEISAAQALIETLAARWPRAFVVFERRRRPLKIGVHLDLSDVEPGLLELALRFYTSNDGYLRAMRPGANRIDLDGNPVGTVTAEEAAAAAGTLERRAIRKARQPAPVPAAPPKRGLTLSDLKAAARARQQQRERHAQAGTTTN